MRKLEGGPMFDIVSFILNLSPILILRIGLLVLLGLYVVFSIIVTVQARAFHRVVYIGDSFGSFFIQLLTILHLLASISLFLLALAIL